MNHRLFLLAALVVLPLGVAAQTAPKTPVPKPAPAEAVVAAAHAALVTGSVTVGDGAATRALRAGDAVYPGQTLRVGPNSYVNLKFADGGRVLLRPDTEFAVESFRYAAAPARAAPAAAAAPQAPAAAEGNAFFRLVRGSFRAITGLIGKADRQDYRVSTPAATIGIRGTDYEVQVCTDDCPAQARAASGATEVAAAELAGLELAQAGGAGAGGGIIVATHAGSISLITPRGETVVDVGQVALALAGGQTFTLPVIPDVMLLNTTTNPSACD